MECPVCYDAVPTVSLNCTHKMCQGCATQWFQRSPTCPICRASVSHPDFSLAAIPVPVQMENLSKAVSMALQAREVERAADSVARQVRQAILDATPVLTLDTQIDFDDDDDDDDDDYDDAEAERRYRERRRGRRQPVEQSNIVGW